jgi:hypothetical protein
MNIPDVGSLTDQLLNQLLGLFQQYQVHYTNESYRVYNFFASHVNCESYFLSLGIWDAFLSKAEHAKYIDFAGDKYNAMLAHELPFLNVGLLSQEDKLFRNIESYFSPPSSVVANTWVYENTIAFGLNYVILSRDDRRDFVITHEVLHLFYGNHVDIVANFSTTPK